MYKKLTDKLTTCPWCQNHKGKTDLQFSIIDDNFAQYVRTSMINYCPFCGRNVRGENEQ